MKTYRIIKAATFLLFAVIVLILNSFFLEHLSLLVGLAMIILSIEGLVYVLFIRKEYEYTKISHNVLCLLLGIVTLFLNKEANFVTVCAIWAVWSIIREEWELSEEVFNKNANKVLAALSLVESAVVIVFSILMIINSTHHHAHVHIYLLSIEFFMVSFIIVAEDILDVLTENKKEKLKNND